jgi:hypothetical protein
VDQARTAFVAIDGDLEFIMGHVLKRPTRKELAWVAPASFVVVAALATVVSLVVGY